MAPAPSFSMPLSSTWTPRRAEGPAQHPLDLDGRWKRIVAASAGYDSSSFIVDSGHVFSSGKSSGRLGLGETRRNVAVPRPVFGGLRLWYYSVPKSARNDRRADVQTNKIPANPTAVITPRVKLIRGSTFG